MSLPVEIQGPNNGTGELLRQSMLRRDLQPGAVVYTKKAIEYSSAPIPFLNDTLGIAMNQNVSFGGTPELIFDGGSGGTEWTGSSVDAEWNFADAGKVTVTSGNNNSMALFSDAGTIDTSAYVAVTGKVDLDVYTPASQDVLFQFQLAGVPVGDALSMNDFINTGDFSEQSFSIPMTTFNTGGATVDELDLTIVRSGGVKPTIAFDDFQIEETGEPISFRAAAPSGTTFLARRLRLLFVDAQASTLASGTMPNLSYDKLLAVPALANGIVLRRVDNGETLFSVNFRQLSDILFAGADIAEVFSDGTNTGLLLEAKFPDPILLKGDTNNNYVEIIINDDLSGLLLFNGAIIGGEQQ